MPKNGAQLAEIKKLSFFFDDYQNEGRQFVFTIYYFSVLFSFS